MSPLRFFVAMMPLGVLLLCACSVENVPAPANAAVRPPSGAVMRPVVRRVAPPPSPVFNVRDYGAKGDGSTADTVAIQKAVDACAGTGGSVLLDRGDFVSAPLLLKSDMTFYVAKGARLLGSDVVSDYPRNDPPHPEGGPFHSTVLRSLLSAWDVKDLTLDGGGEINLRGPVLFAKGMRDDSESARAGILRVCRGKNIAVRNLDLIDSLMWTQVYDRCEGVIIEKLRVVDTPVCGTLDGMDICDCRHAVIRDCFVDTADDAICLKSHGEAGIEDVLIENNTLLSFRNGIKLGTASVGPVKNLRIYDNTVVRAKQTAFSLISSDGAKVSDVEVRGLTVTRTTTPIFIRLSARTEFEEMPGRRLTMPGSIDRVSIRNVLVFATPGTRGSSITGIERRSLGEIRLSDIYVEATAGMKTMPKAPAFPDDGYPYPGREGRLNAAGFYVSHADSVRFENVTVGYTAPDVRDWLVTEKAKVETVSCRRADARSIPLPEESERLIRTSVNQKDFDEK